MTNRLIMGSFDGTFVLRISMPGYDVLNTSLTPNQVVFDSRWIDTSKIFFKGSSASFATSEPGGITSTEIALPLFYNPGSTPPLIWLEVILNTDAANSTPFLDMRSAVTRADWIYISGNTAYAEIVGIHPSLISAAYYCVMRVFE